MPNRSSRGTLTAETPPRSRRRATVLVMIVGLLATLFLIVAAYITLARFDRVTFASVVRADRVDAIVRGSATYVRQLLRETLADGDGNVLAGGRTKPSEPNSAVLDTYSYEDVPGARATRWLAGNEPVRDTTVPMPDLFNALNACQQAVSALDGPADMVNPARPAPATFTRLYQLMVGVDTGGNESGDPFVDPSERNQFVLRNVRRPFMDADGDGLPDSPFVGTRALTEMANAVAGRPMRVPARFGGTPFKPYDIPRLTDPQPERIALAQMWARFDSQARYEVAVKVISHGGLVALASPGRYQQGSPWNREFVTGMFNWVRYRQGTISPDDQLLRPQDNQRFNDLAAAVAEVEPLLRYRGGLLANAAEENRQALPKVLEDLRASFRRTFRVIYDTRAKADFTQRFNLAHLATAGQPQAQPELAAWLAGATLDPDYYNQYMSGFGGGPSPLEYYVRRNLLTTASHSDELARVSSANAPKAIGLYPGQTKFYLGDIARAFDQNTGHFVPGDLTTNLRGNWVVRRLANYYYEMLSDYEGWGDIDRDVSDPLFPVATEVVSRREQAFMLAVNTVAFAAPRARNPVTDNLGFIDTVLYTDNTQPGGDGRVYVGYAPQPFITQVLVHYEGDQHGDGVALAVELYFPHEPGPSANPAVRFVDNAGDPYALDLSQFAITINDLPPTEADRLSALVGRQRIIGRNFIALVIDDGDNTRLRGRPQIFDAEANRGPAIHPDGNNKVTVRLWRYATSDPLNPWRLVDRLIAGDNENPSGGDPLPGTGTDEPSWMASYYRDAAKEPQLGAAGGAGAVPARWRTATGLLRERREQQPNPEDPPIDPFQWAQFFRDPDSDAVREQRFAPTTPLYTMNANLGQKLVHGAWRPNSFPTVGFMLFLPRFSHTGTKPMSETLWKQWYLAAAGSPPERRNSNRTHAGNRPYQASEERYPADFGHMWIFDNVQEVERGPANKSYFADDRSGRIPWGLLVFDYFTTLDPQADYDGDGRPDCDPLRVPGRININTAPWYVLAGLPLLSPCNPRTGAAADVDGSASPAFWSPNSGVLVSNTPIAQLPSGFPLYRFEDPRLSQNRSLLVADVAAAGGTDWLRLGPHLAQAVVSYRDRIQYASYPVSAGQNPHWGAYARNSAAAGPFPQWTQYRKETATAESPPWLGGYAYGSVRRAADRHYGFLSLGELANVKGFDSPLYSGQPGDATQAEYSPLGAGALQPPALRAPDFFRAVSLLALLDTHFLTTRSNTFTVYVSVMDRQNPQVSMRAQLTVDRSNLLPRLVDTALDPVTGMPRVSDPDGPGPLPARPPIVRADGLPEVIAERRTGYFNTQFDQ